MRVSHPDDMPRMGPECSSGIQRRHEVERVGDEATGPTFPESGVVYSSARAQLSPMAGILKGLPGADTAGLCSVTMGQIAVIPCQGDSIEIWCTVVPAEARTGPSPGHIRQ